MSPARGFDLISGSVDASFARDRAAPGHQHLLSFDACQRGLGRVGYGVLIRAVGSGRASDFSARVNTHVEMQRLNGRRISRGEEDFIRHMG